MTVSIEHEELVNDIRSCLWELRKLYPNLDEFAFCIETSMARYFGLPRDIKQMADLYIAPPDSGAIICVEVGRLPSLEKWDFLINPLDNLPIRTLWVTFDRQIYLHNARNTKFEAELIDAILSGTLEPDVCAQTSHRGETSC